jgi:hexosaminidase
MRELIRVLMLFLILFTWITASSFVSPSNASLIRARIPARLLNTIPYPQTVTLKDAALSRPLTFSCKVGSSILLPLVGVIDKELHQISGGRVAVETSGSSPQLSLALDSSLGEQTYRLIIDSNVKIIGGTYQAVAMGTVTLLQMLNRQPDGSFTLPEVTISDSPMLPFRALLIDVARKRHDVRTLEQLIELARWYKINYVQLHLSDDALFTFPSHAFPELPTPEKHYTREELRRLVEFARVRGVSLIPEIEMPGHARPMVERCPDKFGFDPQLKDSKGRTLNTVNLGREVTYRALDKLVAEVADIFRTSTYIHLGGDEANLEPLNNDAEVQRYMAAHKLSNVQELYRQFLVRMNEIVKRHGKQMIVWEGFSKDGQVEIPRDITVMEFETAYQLPQDLLAGGYKVINTSWKPLYVVNEKKWEPQYIYNTWNPYRWENPFPQQPSFTPIQLEQTPQVIGAMMCAWEQDQDSELSSLRQRLPAMSERAWQGGLEPERPFHWFETALTHTDQALTEVLGNTERPNL